MSEEGTPKTEMINPALLDGVSANFIVKGPSGVEKAYPMRQLSVTIGRSDQCDISVKDSSMSGRHVEVSKINGEIKVRDLGSANGVFLNGERVDEAELFDGDVLRLGQTSVRVDVVGGRKRAEGGLSPRLVAGIVAGVLVLSGAGVALGIYLRNKRQHQRDLASVAAFAAAARQGERSKPCAAVVDKVQDVAKTLNSLGKVDCSRPLKGDDARRFVAAQRELSRTYSNIVTAVNQFAGQQSTSSQALTASAEQLVDADLRAKIAEAQDLIDQRTQVTNVFISDWKKLAQATSAYADAAEQALVQGNRSACAALERGVQAKSPSDVLLSCNRNFDKARAAEDEKLKEVEELAGVQPE
jgi:hypothetical protein